MAKKSQEYSGERTPLAFLMAVASDVEKKTLQECDVWLEDATKGDQKAERKPKGVQVGDTRVEVAIEFRAGRPYAEVERERIVSGLSDVNKAISRTAEAVVHSLPGIHKKNAAMKAEDDRAAALKDWQLEVQRDEDGRGRSRVIPSVGNDYFSPNGERKISITFYVPDMKLPGLPDEETRAVVTKELLKFAAAGRSMMDKLAPYLIKQK